MTSSPGKSSSRLVRWSTTLWASTLFRQLASFGVVGAMGVGVNLAVFNLLRFYLLPPDNVLLGPIFATIIASCVAIVFNWVGNRYWAFRKHRRSNVVHEGAEFFIISLLGILFPVVCLGISHYWLGFKSPLADNISANVVGLALGTAFRFVGYRFWVFSPKRHPEVPLKGQRDR